MRTTKKNLQEVEVRGVKAGMRTTKKNLQEVEVRGVKAGAVTMMMTWMMKYHFN
jgi:hypothetical protein